MGKLHIPESDLTLYNQTKFNNLLKKNICKNEYNIFIKIENFILNILFLPTLKSVFFLFLSLLIQI